MKASAGRPQDVRDLQALVTYLHLGTVQEAMDIVQQYIPAHLLTPRLQYIVEGLFEPEEPER
jgi:hypothetical protein